MIDKTGQHVVALPVRLTALLIVLHVELAEKVECDHRVQIDHHERHHNGEDQLLEVMRHRLKNGLQHGKREHDVDEQEGVEKGREEDAAHRADQIEDAVEKLTVGQDDAGPQPTRVPYNK